MSSFDVVRFFGPPELMRSEAHEKATRLGQSVLDRGGIGVILLAGGVGTRAKVATSKGLVEFGPNNETLFELYARKIYRTCKNTTLFVMTNPSNYQEIVQTFARNKNWGLESVYFFMQQVEPASDGVIYPKGSGNVFEAFDRAGFTNVLSMKSIDYLSLMLIDNPLVEMLDPTFVGLMMQESKNYGVKIVELIPDEPCARVFLENSRVRTVDYYDPEAQQRQGISFGLTGMSMFSAHFMQTIAPTLRHRLPKHKIVKNGVTRFEQSILDLPAMMDPDVLFFMVLREQEFSPFKNETGDFSYATARKDFFRKYGEVFKEVF